MGPYDLAMLFYASFVIRSIFGGPMPPTPEFDSDEQLLIKDKVLRDARDRVIQDGDWRAARDAIDAAGEDWDLRGYRLWVLGDLVEPDDEWFEEWLRAEPESPAVALIQAGNLHSRAAKARGGDVAANTSAEQFRAFNALSRQAAEAGVRAMELAAPNDPGPVTLLMRTLFAGGAEALDDLYAEALRRDPHNFDAHELALVLRCQKWFGSHEQMFAIARAASEAAPAGNRAVLMPLYAHIEYALREFAWGDRDKKTEQACRRYFRTPEVQQEVDRCIAKWRAAEPSSVRLAGVRQWMAVYYCLIGRRAEAKAVFDELGEHVRPSIEWGWMLQDREYAYMRNWWWANGVFGA